MADYGYDVLAYILIIMTLMDFGIGIGLIITGFKRRKKPVESKFSLPSTGFFILFSLDNFPGNRLTFVIPL